REARHKPSRGMSNKVAKDEARINQNHAFDFECERFRLTRGAAQAEQKDMEQIQDSLLTPN
ncbi:hypothetical protein J6O48_09075, partial [bacterium]|nr:hypothetical protein [bacterium]